MQMNTYGLKKIPRGYCPGVFFFWKTNTTMGGKRFFVFSHFRSHPNE